MGVCVLDKDTYYEKAINHFFDTTTYKKVTHFPLNELLHQLNSIVKKI